MTDMTNAAPVAATSPGLPDEQRRMIELDDAIAKIRTQIATADLARQRGHKPIDPDWFHRARTALRHLSRERAELLFHKYGLVKIILEGVTICMSCMHLVIYSML